ncbi:fungal protein [Schizosaccharomyces japonicus yFS275]|uniref:Fungal protein n=1 Tax=Schizosaccharomyces japonicus (strain yFS275 / FY16936) TaxID=402676 RepID=B6K4D3_SCHJY|nr:fungal protein [Schizosaccharomyces japonicus yFS275]EEB08340.1 fungal protein [Schizosaccharomyces japonicus yFS275]
MHKINHKSQEDKSKYRSVFFDYIRIVKGIVWDKENERSRYDLWRRFVKRWNDKRMDETWYKHPSLKRSRNVVLGPARPTLDDLYKQEEVKSRQHEEQTVERKTQFARRKREETELLDEIAPREPSGSKQASLQKKRLKSYANKVYRDEAEDDLNVDEKSLMGSEETIQERIERQRMRQQGFEQKRKIADLEKIEQFQKRLHEKELKEQETIEHLRKLAQERFQKHTT